MFRAALTAQIRPAVVAQHRNFVSTVLLMRTWENESVNDLRKEAKKRGLSPRGNRATLITRLQRDEEQKTLASTTPLPSQPKQVRHASTETEVPGIPSTANSGPVWPKEFMDIKIPDVSQPIPEPQTQVPFVPDLWDSSKVKADSAPPEETDSSIPKILAVAGAATHHGGGPSHNLYPSATESVAPVSVSFSRPLEKDERTGVWLLLGLLAGSWLAGGYFKAPSAFAEQAEVAVEKAGQTTEKH
ncbi:hypothetical protein A0H81_04265 [Grifola frondosa]|uniref:SAP domain-containing protein n=1 Tax=Grifola frondosa TaxID=5627 RepID=A0A1C7MDW5_GRIFR|nr:hypothetical protein A0H81_04265 [Grifola frondosa]